MMKKTILLLLAAFCGVLTVAAQDLIIKADASKVEAKVTEITPESVRYKRFSNPDGPTYVLREGVFQGCREHSCNTVDPGHPGRGAR